MLISQTCFGYPPRYDNSFAYMCDDVHLRPICVLPRVPCAQTDCLINDKVIPSGSPLADTNLTDTNECISLVCYNGYGMTRIDETCTFTGKQSVD